MLEKCGTCGFEHHDMERVTFKRNHVSNKLTPFCNICERRLYLVCKRNLLLTSGKRMREESL